MSRRAALAAILSAGLALAPAAAVAAPDITGVWRMAQPSEITDPRQRTPPIPPPPLKPEAAAAYEAGRAAVRAADAEGRPFARDRELCIPDGMPRMLTTDSPVEILQTKGQVTIVHEFMSVVRRIDLMRRAHPPAEEIEPGFFGDSIGRWEKGTLVVDTVGLKPRVLLFNDVPRSPALRIVERIRLLSPGVLEDEVTLIDPEVLERPWVVKRVFVRRPDLKVGESVCTENNRNYRDADGRLATRIP